MAQQLRALSQNLHDGSQPSMLLQSQVIWHTASPGLCGHQAHTWYTDIHRQKTYIHVIKIHKSSRDRLFHHSFLEMPPMSSSGLRRSPGLHVLHDSGQKSSREKFCCNG